MEPDATGDFVRYSDYADLERQIAELRAERDALSVHLDMTHSEKIAAEAENARLSEALREYENPTNWGVNARFDANSSRFDGTSFAHGILVALSGSGAQPALPLKDEVERVLEREGEPVTLAACPVGLFESGSGELCLKTEYGSNEGQIYAYIVSSGEFFWGRTVRPADQREVTVQPVAVRALRPRLRAGEQRPIS